MLKLIDENTEVNRWKRWGWLDFDTCALHSHAPEFWPKLFLRAEGVQGKPRPLSGLHHQHVLRREVSWRQTFGEEAHRGQSKLLLCSTLFNSQSLKPLHLFLCPPHRWCPWSADIFMKWLKWKGRRLSTASACRFLRPASMISSTLCSAPQQQRSPPPPLSLLVRSKMWKPTRYDCTFLCHRSRFRFDSFVKMSEFGYIWIICTLFDSASVTKGTEPATFTSSVVKVNACFVRTPH